MKKILLSTYLIFLTILTGCQNTVFGVKKDVWDTLSEEQKQQVIIDYHKLESEKQRHAAEIRALELENEAKLAPYRILRDAIAKVNSNDNQKEKTKV